MKNMTVKVYHHHYNDEWRNSATGKGLMCVWNAKTAIKLNPNWRAAKITVGTEPRKGAKHIRVVRRAWGLCYTTNSKTLRPRNSLFSEARDLLSRRIPELKENGQIVSIYVSVAQVKKAGCFNF